MCHKIKKWGKKRYWYGWLTVPEIEYTCSYSSISRDNTPSEISRDASRSPGRILGIWESDSGIADYNIHVERGLEDTEGKVIGLELK